MMETKALVIVLGIPAAVVGEVETWVEAAFVRPVRVHAVPATDDDNRPYNKAQVAQAFQSAVGFAVRKRRAERQPAPSSILLLYVPGGTDEPAVAPFDFFVFPAPLYALSVFENGRQLRHDRGQVEQAIAAVLDPESDTMQRFAAVQERVAAVRDAEALQLPPDNFKLDDEAILAGIFRALRRGERPWDDAIEELVIQEFGKAELPRLRKYERRRAYRDARGLVFLRADLHEHHGANRELLDEDEIEEDGAAMLRGAFRFGCPLLPGFHHDVQLEEKRPLGDLKFACGQKGTVTCGHVYINIYPNDVVRGRKLAVL